MARPRATLADRGYLHAQKQTPTDPVWSNEARARTHNKRQALADAWVAGYKAAQNDSREKRRDSRR